MAQDFLDINNRYASGKLDALGNLCVSDTNSLSGNSFLTSIDNKITVCNTSGVTVSAALPAGTNIVGKVGIDQTTDGTTNKVQAHLNVSGAAQTSSNPAPVQSPGFVSSVSQTRPNDTTAYTALDVVGQDPASNMQFTGIGSVAGGHVIITGISLRIDSSAIPSGMTSFRLHLYDAAPTAIIDNAAFNLISADRTKYLGFIEIATPTDLGDTCWSRNDNINFKCKLASASTDLYGVLQTISGFTPSAQTVKTVRISGVQC